MLIWPLKKTKTSKLIPQFISEGVRGPLPGLPTAQRKAGLHVLQRRPAPGRGGIPQ